MIAAVGVYDQGRRIACSDLEAALARWSSEDGTFVWIGFFQPTAAELGPVVEALGIHPLAAEDAVHGRQRPKLEQYDDELFVVSKTVRYVDHEEVIETGDLLAFLGRRFIVTVRHGTGIDIAAMRRKLEADPATLSEGPARVLHGLLDLIVDDYTAAIDLVEEDVDEVQGRVFAQAGIPHSQRIFLLKREVLQFRQAVTPLREPLADLATRRHESVPEEMQAYFRDVEDHLLRVIDRLMNVDAILSSALDANIAQVSIRQNEDMRKMSAWLGIGAVPTVMGAIYGMNFQHMPELGWKYGYLIVMAVTVLACLGLHRNFKRRGWL